METNCARNPPLYHETEVWQMLKDRDDVKQLDCHLKALMCMTYGGNHPVDFWHTELSTPRVTDARVTQWRLSRVGDLVQDMVYPGKAKHAWLQLNGRTLCDGPSIVTPKGGRVALMLEPLPLIAMGSVSVRIELEDGSTVRRGDHTVIKPLFPDVGHEEIADHLMVRYTLLPTHMRRDLALNRPREWQGVFL